MLVLRRKAGEAIVLNGVITIHVLAVEGERVKLGISALPEVVIVRSELLENQGGMGAMGGPGNSYSNAPSPLRLQGSRPYHTPDAEGRPASNPGLGSQNGYSRYTSPPRPAYPSEPASRPAYPGEPAPRPAYTNEPAPRPAYPGETSETTSPYPTGPLRYRP